MNYCLVMKLWKLWLVPVCTMCSWAFVIRQDFSLHSYECQHCKTLSQTLELRWFGCLWLYGIVLDSLAQNVSWSNECSGFSGGRRARVKGRRLLAMLWIFCFANLYDRCFGNWTKCFWREKSSVSWFTMINCSLWLAVHAIRTCK